MIYTFLCFLHKQVRLLWSGRAEMENGGGRDWLAPSPPPPRRGLQLNNSLCGCKVPFYTSDGSSRVTWYICGPTVYDTSHVGHARNYLTFDILRRVMEGFFRYQVLYVMNVTDVDDKIIHRARRNHLLDQYLTATPDLRYVIQDLRSAFDEEISTQEKKVENARKEFQHASGASRRKQELDDKLRQEELKLAKLNEAFCKAKEREEKVSGRNGKEGLEMLLADGVGDVLSAYLDGKKGCDVTDLEIFRAHAAKYERDFLKDMQLLGVKLPDVLTRVTEYIDVIIQFIQQIIDKGIAYASNGSVYFDTKAFQDAGHVYAKMNPSAVGSVGLASDSESNFVTKDKRNSCDFALWKASKAGEPFWESPWGHGRPGWHIECSAMATDIIGPVIDIHSGGHDLIFPHHDNELAQAEAYLGCSQWVNYFLHSGHLSIEGLKMSKSLKNFITIKEALNRYTSRQLRFLFVNQAWDKPMNFGESVMNEAIGKERTFQNFFMIVKNYLRKARIEEDNCVESYEGPQRLGPEEKLLLSALKDAQMKVQERLEDNIDTSGALLALLNLVSSVNTYIDRTVNDTLNGRVVRKSAVYVTEILAIFGLSNARPGEVGFDSDGHVESGVSEMMVSRYLDAMASFRHSVRLAVRNGASKEEILEMADKFRDNDLVNLGIRLEDKPDGPIWELVDPKILQKEREEKHQKAIEAQINSLQLKLDRKVKDLEKYNAALVDPNELYSAFNLQGYPTHDAEGKELSKKARKDFEKKLSLHENFKQKLVAEPNLMEQLKSDIEDLERQILELRSR